MKIVIPGGSGQIGTLLAPAMHGDGHEVVVLSRAPHAHPWPVMEWDGRTVGRWAAEIDGADVVINLAGRSVNCRCTPENRRDILESRTLSTAAVGGAIAAAVRPPRVWLQASTATIYAHRFDAPNDEAHGPLGGSESGAPDTWRFSIDVALAWEAALDAACTPHTRKLAMRSAMTISPDRGGVFDALLGLVRRGLGGRAGSGRQYVSWIHERDFVRAASWQVASPSTSPPGPTRPAISAVAGSMPSDSGVCDFHLNRGYARASSSTFPIVLRFSSRRCASAASARRWTESTCSRSQPSWMPAITSLARLSSSSRVRV